MEPFIGEIRMFAGNFAPENWLFCDGSLLAIANYDALHQLIGTTYGGDGTNTFALPDLRGRVPICAGAAPGLTNRTIGEASGTESVVLTEAQMPPHSHALNGTTGVATSATPGPGMMLASTGANFLPYNDISVAAGTLGSFAPAAIGNNSPAGGAHENRMPSVGINFIIAVQGIFPGA